MGDHLVPALLIATALAWPAALGAQAPFRAGIDLVHVGVTVLDEDGHFVTDLKAENFELYEEGKRQKVSFFSCGESGDLDERRMRLGLLFDTSGSMTEDIRLARAGAIRFLNTFPKAEDFARMVERIRERRPDGWTALYDALGTYLDGSYDLDGRKVMVLYTDGGDTRSAVTFAEALEMLRAADVTVYVIGFLQNQPASIRNTQRMQLMQLADVTGGEAFFPSSKAMIEKIFDEVSAQIQAQYHLGFVSNDTRRDGRWRKLEVRLTGTRPKRLKIRARAGYYAPYQTASATERSSAHP